MDLTATMMQQMDSLPGGTIQTQREKSIRASSRGKYIAGLESIVYDVLSTQLDHAPKESYIVTSAHHTYPTLSLRTTVEAFDHKKKQTILALLQDKFQSSDIPIAASQDDIDIKFNPSEKTLRVDIAWPFLEQTHRTTNALPTITKILILVVVAMSVTIVALSLDKGVHTRLWKAFSLGAYKEGDGEL